jgi:hypothetical protein
VATLWDRELPDEVALVGQLDPEARLQMIVRLLEWTIDALPSRQRSLLARKRRRTVDAAMALVRSAAAGSPPDMDSEEVAELEDKLQELADDFAVQDLWQLFVALSNCVGVPAEEFTAEFTAEIMSACYDVIRDCEDLPEFPVGTPESTVLGQERANANCMAAIAKQKEVVRDAVARSPSG